jgi:hypothetical protein
MKTLHIWLETGVEEVEAQSKEQQQPTFKKLSIPNLSIKLQI